MNFEGGWPVSTRGTRIRNAAVTVLSGLILGAAPLSAKAQSLSEIFKSVNPAVVVIHTTEREIPPAPYTQPVSVAGLGSGVLVSPDGQVLTAAHVVQTADAIVVEFLTGEMLRARVVSSEPSADVALLQLERTPRAPLTARLGDSDAVQIGDQVLVIGAPLGASHTLTVGHVSARRKPDGLLGRMSRAEFFQTDAAINPGDSGGPMFNMAGEVVGVVSHILSSSGGSEGLGFAVTSNVTRRLLLEEKSFWSGLSGYLISGDLARVLNVPPPGAGLLVQGIASGSPADRIGLHAGMVRATIGADDLIVGGDIILEVESVPLEDPESYLLVRRRLTSLPAGQPITITILRAGMRLKLTLTADARDPQLSESRP
jgi:serine protease Do